MNYGTAAPEVDLASARKDFLEGFPQLRDKRFLLFLGRLHEKKGCELLLEAFAALPRSGRAGPALELVIAGPSADEAYEEHLKRMAPNAGITFTGMLSGSLKWGALSAAEAFILPSHQENFGIAVVEALACGTPVLISNKVNIWREIVADEAGYVENDDLAGTARLLERWVKTTPDVRAAMRDRARKCFAQHFEINGATDSLLDVLENRQGRAE